VLTSGRWATSRTPRRNSPTSRSGRPRCARLAARTKVWSRSSCQSPARAWRTRRAGAALARKLRRAGRLAGGGRDPRHRDLHAGAGRFLDYFTTPPTIRAPPRGRYARDVRAHFRQHALPERRGPGRGHSDKPPKDWTMYAAHRPRPSHEYAVRGRPHPRARRIVRDGQPCVSDVAVATILARGIVQARRVSPMSAENSPNATRSRPRYR